MLAPNSENGSNNKTNNFVFAPEVPMHGNNTQFRPSGSDFFFNPDFFKLGNIRGEYEDEPLTFVHRSEPAAAVLYTRAAPASRATQRPRWAAVTGLKSRHSHSRVRFSISSPLMSCMRSKLADPSWRVRQDACTVVGLYSPEERAAYFSRMLELLRDENWTVRRAAGAVIERATVSEMSAHLTTVGAMLRDNDADVRRIACNIIGKHSAEERAAYLASVVQMMRDLNWRVRIAACAVICQCSAGERAPYMGTIVAMLGDPNGDARKSASEVLALCSSKERVPYLEQIGETTNKDSKEITIMTVVQI